VILQDEFSEWEDLRAEWGTFSITRTIDDNCPKSKSIKFTLFEEAAISK
jgi:hypothetical protein